MSANHTKRQPWPTWLKILFSVSGTILFLTSIFWANLLVRRLQLDDAFRPAFLADFATVFQVAAIILFSVSASLIFWQRRNGQVFVLEAVYGAFTLLSVFLLEIFKVHINPITPPVMGLTDGTNNLVVYISAISGLIAAISGLYGQVMAGKKTLAEIELEKQKLAFEREKLQRETAKTSGPGTKQK